MTHRVAPRPWRTSKPVHTTSNGWRVSIHNGAIVAAKAVGVTRGHAVANAALISRAIIVNDHLSRILSETPTDHEEARRLVWLREKLKE
jgi:hypothetical protein